MRTEGKSYSLIPFRKTFGVVGAMGLLYLLKRKTSFMQNRYYTALELPSSLGLYRPTKLASTSYSVSLCGCYNLFQRRTTPSTQVGSSWTSTSSLGFPGGSLGRRNKLAGLMFICRPLTPCLDLVVLDNYFASA